MCVNSQQTVGVSDPNPPDRLWRKLKHIWLKLNNCLWKSLQLFFLQSLCAFPRFTEQLCTNPQRNIALSSSPFQCLHRGEWGGGGGGGVSGSPSARDHRDAFVHVRNLMWSEDVHTGLPVNTRSNPAGALIYSRGREAFLRRAHSATCWMTGGSEDWLHNLTESTVRLLSELRPFEYKTSPVMDEKSVTG